MVRKGKAGLACLSMTNSSWTLSNDFPTEYGTKQYLLRTYISYNLTISWELTASQC